jgi:D-alanyl-D-alanine carboxypeptidase/D-alanyl-D-alanine-endopeptidase (penicillin-binding protein 4)
MIRSIGLLTLVLLVSCHLLHAQGLPELKKAVEILDKDLDMRSASWGISVIDLSNGHTVLMHQGDKSLITASTMKAVTTATALAVLGPDFRFRTYLEYDGSLENGVLRGNLYIRGEGDPSLGSHRFDEQHKLAQLMIAWAEVIQKAGIKQIQGRVVADASFLGSQLTPGNWNWEDMGNYYGAGASGLNIHENFYRLDFRSPATTGSQTEILRTVPSINGIEFVNEVRSGPKGSGDNAYIFGSPYTWLRYVRGTIPPGRSAFSIKGSIPDPPLYCARRFEEELIKCGITLSQPASSIRLENLQGRPHTAKRTLLHTHRSPSLADLVKETNMESLNLYAEALALRTAVARKQKGTTAEAAETMTDYWKAQGVATKGMRLRDGSGLSANNVVSTHQMAKILYLTSQTPHYSAFRSSLPLAGRSGSLRSMLRGTTAEGRLRAKSGYISGVRAYAGYVEAVNGKKYAFAMISNHYSCSAGQMRRKFEKLMVKLAEGK